MGTPFKKEKKEKKKKKKKVPKTRKKAFVATKKARPSPADLFLKKWEFTFLNFIKLADILILRL